MTKAKNSRKTTAEKTFEVAQEKVQEKIQETVKEATENFDNISEFSKANYEALVASGNIAVKVARSANADFAKTAKKAVEKNIADAKTLFSAKTPAEFFELQSGIFKARYDEFMAETTRINEVTTATANDVVAPIKARYEEVAKKYNFPVTG